MVFLAFLPDPDPDGTVGRYEVFLINDTASPALFTSAFFLRDVLQARENGKIGPRSFHSLGFLFFDHLNDQPVYELECWRVSTEGTGPRIFRNLRIKPQQFFRNARKAPLLDQQAHVFEVFQSLEPPPPKADKKQDLRTYTKEMTGQTGEEEDIYGDWRDALPGVKEYAEFIPEIDLHIEVLTERHAQLSTAEILRTQMSHFEKFLAKAIRLGVPSVFIIHGVGKGVLRDAIAQRLRQHPNVPEFKNEYHPKYGWGATEVIFTG